MPIKDSMKKRTILILSILFGASFWVIDALVDSLIFSHVSLLDSMLTTDPHEVFMRAIIIIMLIFFGVIANTLFREKISNLQRLDEELQKGRIELEEMVISRTTELEKTNEELRKEILERVKADFALRGSEKKYRELISKLPVGVYRTSIDGKIIEANEALAAILGVESVSDLLNHSVFDFYLSQEDRNKLLDKQISSTDTLVVEVQMKRLDGNMIWIHDRARAHTGESGEIKYIDGIVEDITERKQAELALKEGEMRYSELFSKLLDIMFKIDLSGKFLILSPSAERITGFAAHELIGRNIRKFINISPDSIDSFFMALKKTGKINGFNLSFKRKDGAIAYLSINAHFSFGENGRVDSIEGTARDVTEELKSKELISTLYQITNSINSSSSLEELYKAIHASLLNVVPVHNMFIAIYNDESQKITFPYVFDERDKQIEAIKIDEPSSFTAKVIREGKPLMMSKKDINQMIRNTKKVFDSIPMVWLGMPLKAGKKSIGAIGLKSYIAENLYSENDLSTLATVCEQIAVAIEKKLIEQEVIAARERAELIYRVTPSCIFTINKDYKVTSWNKRIEDITGYLADEAMGKHCSFLAESLPDEVFIFLTEEIKRPLYGKESIIYTKSGSIKIISKNFEYLRNHDGEVSGVIISFEDITGRKRIEEALFWQAGVNSAIAELSKAILSSATLDEISNTLMTHAANLTNSEFGFVGYLNQPWDINISASIGITEFKQEMIDSLNRLIEIEYGWKKLNEKMTLATNDSFREGRLRNFMKMNPDIKHLIVSPAMSGEKVLGVVAVGSQSKEYSSNDIEIIERLASLYSIAFQRFKAEQDIRLALEKEQELNELKSRFILMVSHEYRTPLSAIMLSTELLQDYYNKMTPEEKEKHFGRIHLSIHSMTKLLDDIITFNKLDIKAIQFAPNDVNLESLSKSLVHEVDLIHKNKCKINYKFEADEPVVAADEKLLRQIITNLLSNAIKYSHEGSEIEYNIIKHGSNLELVVKDHGIGIPEADQKKLFQPFHRASNVGTISGTGLGLGIIKSSVEMHGGTITFDSRVGIGTTFTVNIPVKSKSKAIISTLQQEHINN